MSIPTEASPSRPAPWWVAPALSLAIVIGGGLIVWGRVDAQVSQNTKDIAENAAAIARTASKEELRSLKDDLTRANGLLFQIALALGVKPQPAVP